MAYILAAGFIIPATIAGMIWRGYVLSILWGWFVVGKADRPGRSQDKEVKLGLAVERVSRLAVDLITIPRKADWAAMARLSLNSQPRSLVCSETWPGAGRTTRANPAPIRIAGRQRGHILRGYFKS